MKLQKQQTLLPVLNFDKLIPQNNEIIDRHGCLLPNTVRAIFVGPSNCDKTNALLSLIINPNGRRFENIYLYSKSLNQLKYEFLKNVLDPIEGVQYFPFSDHEDVLTPDDAKPNRLMIFDDIACEKQDHVRSYFCHGRHKKVDSFISVRHIHVYQSI